MLNKQELRKNVEHLLIKTGKMLMSSFRKPVAWEFKEDSSITTQMDVDVEEHLIKHLTQFVPEASVLAEESGSRGQQEAHLQWVIDPIDGTTNFVFGIPYFCISIALTENHKPIMSFLYVPVTQELFYAAKGEGAYLNGQRIVCGRPEGMSIDKALLLVGFPRSKNAAYHRVLEAISQLSLKSYAFRHFGAIALDLAYVAAGFADALFFEDLSWWDVAAGLLLIEEAGGVVTTYDGGKIGPEFQSFVAANKTLHEKLLLLLEKK